MADMMRASCPGPVFELRVKYKDSVIVCVTNMGLVYHWVLKFGILVGGTDETDYYSESGQFTGPNDFLFPQQRCNRRCQL